MNHSTTTPENTPLRSDVLDPHHVFAGLASGTARYWKSRAQVFEWARPHPDDFHGRATPEGLAAQWDRLTALANACKARAEVAERYGCTPADMALVVGVAEALVAA